MHIAVLGAAGWVGRAVLADLQSHGHRVRAIDHGPAAWDGLRDLDGDWHGDLRHADVGDYDAVDAVLEDVDAVVHAAVLPGVTGAYAAGDDRPWRVNLKGLWNTLHVAHRRGLRRVVHVGSCQVQHPEGLFFDAHVRRPDGGLYAVTKRLQEEMCRQFHEATGLAIVVLRPCSIVDSRLGIDKYRRPLQGRWSIGWVCRHDLAEACRRAIEVAEIRFEVLHTAGAAGAEAWCNVARTQRLLGVAFQGDLERYR